MAQIAKMESQVDIKSSAERFYETFKNKQNHLPKMCPNVVQDIQLIKGDWESIGSLRKWIFAPAGDSSTEIATIRIEAADDKKKSVTFSILDGNLKKLYNSFVVTIEAIEKADGSGSTLKTTSEYEKVNPGVPEPGKYFVFASLLYKNGNGTGMGEALPIGNPRPWPCFYFSRDGDGGWFWWRRWGWGWESIPRPHQAPSRPVAIPKYNLMILNEKSEYTD
ncbi:hypothetical protein TIFTF001_035653 [Ficus carica]|uniref:Bet v I/Major latex protein domain-containing protein n=1 Tax=Ficus carica TaxID=3494 RepID=A0AA88E1Z9_FICCA|nr:hypothetical protein TIFTF001_035653 [Ficus carica]